MERKLSREQIERLEGMSPKEVETTVQQRTADILYFHDHRAEWFEECGEQWVAVHEEERIAVAQTEEEIWAIDDVNALRGRVVVRPLKLRGRKYFLVAA